MAALSILEGAQIDGVDALFGQRTLYSWLAAVRYRLTQGRRRLAGGQKGRYHRDKSARTFHATILSHAEADGLEILRPSALRLHVAAASMTDKCVLTP